jgi:hypothetical protein
MSEQSATATLSAAPPEGATVLFDGTNLDAWIKRRGGEPAAWPIENGEMITRGGDIQTRQTFENFYLHVEFLCPDRGPDVQGQGRSNSGVYLQGRYEIQVLDSFHVAEPGFGDCGAIYNQAAPLVRASGPPDTWQTYDIVFRAPRFDGRGEKNENARVTLLHNGRVVHNNQEIPRQTGGALDERYAAPGPILLQDHGDAVRYRNLWIVPLPARGANHY